MLATVSNLFPRPDQPRRGLFNLHLFKAMSEALEAARGPGGSGADSPLSAAVVPSLQNICLVPEWRRWRWPGIRGWNSQDAGDRGGPPFPTQYLPVWYAPGVGRDWSWRTYGWALQGLRNIVRWRKAVLATWLYPDGVATARLAAQLGIPCWIMVQGSDVFHLRQRRRLRAVMTAAATVEGFFCVCTPLADALIHAGIASRKIHVVPNGVDAGLFRFRSQAEAAVELTRGASGLLKRWDLTDLSIHYVLFVGNLVSVKNPSLLLDAWAGALAGDNRNSRNARLVILGDGPLASDLQRQAERLGIDGATLLLGSRPQSEVALWMNRADALCLTSLSEGMPNVVLEALASGLPVVATDVGACREILGHEPAARLCVPGDRVGISRGLRDILSTAYDRRAMAERNRDRHSWKRQAETMLGIMGLLKEIPVVRGGPDDT